MSISLSPEIQRLIDERVRSGEHRTPEDVIAAEVATLDQQEQAGDVQGGELARRLSVADAEIEPGELLDGEKVFRELRELGKDPQSRAE